MPYVERDGASIYYEDRGSGYPLLLLAPGGLNPLAAFADDFRIIAMDQRNADRSSGPLVSTDAWGMYADDQMAVLDALDIEKALVAGSCIGCSFIFELLKRHSQRVVAGVLMQPIGHDDSNEGSFGPGMWTPWGESLISNGSKLTLDEVNAFGHSLFDQGFVFSADRDLLKTFQTPLMLLHGNDRAHPKGVSIEVGSLLPNVEIVERWRDEDVVPEVTEKMRTFLKRNVPPGQG
jgi:pimeloyl-ACP methyl ester carboxylesterase